MKRFNSSSFPLAGGVITVLALGIGAAGCNSGSSAPQSAAPQQSSAPAWSLLYQSTCTQTQGSAADNCVGAYGFKVNADGTFEVGPGPQGQTAQGKLDAEDFTDLTQAASGAIDGSSASALSTEQCNGYFANDADYTLTIAKHGRPHELMHKKGADLCSAELNAEAAESLHEEIVKLAEKYYATPFPDTCQEAAAQVEAFYAPLTQCHVDADCAYLTEDFTPIATDSENTVYLDNCSRVKPLPVANRNAVQANLQKLQTALSNAQTVCGVRIARDDCSQPKSFNSSAAPAVCQQGVCRVNPQLTQ